MEKEFKLGAIPYSLRRSMPYDYHFEMTMRPSFINWHPVAKNRLAAVNVLGASDFMNKNIDYHFQVNGWKRRMIFGRVRLAIPRAWMPGIRSEKLKKIARDAVRQEISMDFPDDAKKLIQKVDVIRSYKKRGKRK